MKIQQHDGVMVDAAVTAAGLRRSLRRRRRSWRGEGGARGMGCGCPPSPPLYIGSPRGGRRPWRSNLPRGRRPRGEECSPRHVVRSPHPRDSTLGAGGGPRGAHQPTMGWFPSHFSPWGPPGWVAPPGGPPGTLPVVLVQYR